MRVAVTETIIGLKKLAFMRNEENALRYGDIFVEVLASPELSKDATQQVKVRRALLAVKIDDILEGNSEDTALEISASQATDLMSLVNKATLNTILVMRCAEVLDQIPGE